MEAIAKTRHLKGSPRKARLVIDLIRGRNVSQALNILKFTDKRAADPIEKTLRSAIANATYQAEQQNIAIDPDDLFVKTCFVDMGAHKNRRRMRPAPQGRAFREQRHYCHITILVSSDKTTEETKSAKKSQQTSGEKGDGGAKTKDAPKPKAAKAEKVKETKPASAEKAPKAKETKKAKAEKSAEEKVEAVAPVIETPAETATAAVPETPVVSDPVAEMMHTKETPEEAVEARADELRAEESEAAEIAETVEAKPEQPTEAKTAKASEEDTDILEMDSPKVAKEKTDKQKTEASDAKNVQSQTPAERNETKKADDAQLDENDILELQ